MGQMKTYEVATSDVKIARVFVPICMALATINTLYNNLLINLRFRCKISCKTAGVCVYDCVNHLICYTCLKKLCRDKCFELLTLVKWGVKAAIFGYTIYLVSKISA